MEAGPHPAPRRQSHSEVLADPRSRRQLGLRGPVLFWRDGAAGRREGLVCLVSACGNPACDCHDVWIDGLLIDDRATSVSGGASSLRVSWPAGTDPPRGGPWPLRAAVNLETRSVRPRADDVRGDLVDWFRAELDEVLIEVLRRRWRLAKR